MYVHICVAGVQGSQGARAVCVKHLQNKTCCRAPHAQIFPQISALCFLSYNSWHSCPVAGRKLSLDDPQDAPVDDESSRGMGFHTSSSTGIKFPCLELLPSLIFPKITESQDGSGWERP